MSARRSQQTNQEVTGSLRGCWHRSEDEQTVEMETSQHLYGLNKLHFHFINLAAFQRSSPEYNCVHWNVGLYLELVELSVVSLEKTLWSETELRCLVVMKAHRPTTVHNAPLLLRPGGSLSHHLQWLRFITAHFRRPPITPPPLSPLRLQLCSCLTIWILFCTFWTLIIARMERGEPGYRRIEDLEKHYR